MINFLKTNFLAILVIVLFIFLMFRPAGCGRDRDNRIDTVRVETVKEYIPQPPVQIPVYIPGSSTSYPVVIPPSYKPSEDQAKLLQQYNDLVKEYLAVRKYKDSITLKDSSGNRVGVVNLNDEVAENKIKSREPSYQLTLPVITNTITLKEPYRPNNQVYIGGGITGNQSSIVNGAYLGAFFKNKQDRVFGVNAGIQTVNGKLEPQFGLSTYWKIKLKK